MGNVNKHLLVGKIGSDAKKIEFKDGGYLVKASLVTNNKVKGKEFSTWHNIQFSDAIKDVALKLIKKGDTVYSEGFIDIQNKDGKTFVTHRSLFFEKLNKSKEKHTEDQNNLGF